MKKIHSHNNFYYFTGSLVFLLLASAYVSTSSSGEDHRLLDAVMLLTEFVAYFTLSLTKKWRRFIGLMFVLLLISSLLRVFTEWTVAPLSGLVVVLIFYCGVAYSSAKQALFGGHIELNSVVGSLAVYLLLGLIWAVLYLITLEIWPTGINGIEYQNWHDNFGVAVYFSFVTMTSLGYGDISPAIPFTRALAYLQAITGTFYMAIVVASLVGTLKKKSQ
jgi:voltage-gated potassium channel